MPCKPCDRLIDGTTCPTGEKCMNLPPPEGCANKADIENCKIVTDEVMKNRKKIVLPTTGEKNGIKPSSSPAETIFLFEDPPIFDPLAETSLSPAEQKHHEQILASRKKISGLTFG